VAVEAGGTGEYLQFSDGMVHIPGEGFDFFIVDIRGTFFGM